MLAWKNSIMHQVRPFKRLKTSSRLPMLLAISVIFAQVVSSSVGGSGINHRSEFSGDATSPSSSATEDQSKKRTLPPCPKHPPGLVGQVFARESEAPPVLEPGSEPFVDWYSRELRPGGAWRPSHCLARQKVAIVVPYRDRAEHLSIFLHHMHPFLQRQQIDYRIVIVEQSPEEDFNRGALTNIGYTEASKFDDYDCLIVHDIDLLAEDDRNMYTCPDQVKGDEQMNRVKHMSVAIDKMDYRLPYTALVGGVLAIPTRLFRAMNGFSNALYGWGGEDDDLHHRMDQNNITVTRDGGHIAKYTMIKHQYVEENVNLKKMMEKSKRNELAGDGLSNLKYNVLEKDEKPLYTWVLVRLPVGPKTPKTGPKTKSWWENTVDSLQNKLFNRPKHSSKSNQVY